MHKKEFPQSKTFNFAASIDYAAAAIVSKTVLKNPKGNVSLFAFDQGEGLSEHTAPCDALVQIIDGKAEVLIEGNSFILSAGESIIMPAHIPHALNAVERFKMVLTLIKE